MTYWVLVVAMLASPHSGSGWTSNFIGRMACEDAAAIVRVKYPDASVSCVPRKGMSNG